MMLYLIETSICLAICYLVYMLFFRQETFFQRNRYFLLISLGGALLIPQLEWNTFSPIQAPQLILEEFVLSADQPLSNSFQIEISQILQIIYILVAIVLAGRWLFPIWKIIHIIQQSEVHHRRGYKLVYTQGRYPTFSFFNYVFWDNTQKLSDEEADQVLSHELKHVWDKHTYDIVVIELFKIIFWFNPVIYFYSYALKLQHEYIADAAVLKESTPQSYTHLLLKVGFKHLNFPIVHKFGTSTLKKRVVIIHQEPTPSSYYMKTLVLIPLLGILCWIFAQPSLEKSKATVIEYVSENAHNIEMNRFATVDGGLDRLYQEISGTMYYPSSARKAGVEGKVYLQFVVNTDGTLSEIEVIKGIHPVCDKLALKALKQAKTRWLPAKVDGVIVKQRLTIPISFYLNEKKS